MKMVKLESILRMRYNIAHGLVTAAQNAPNARKGPGGMPWREAASVLLVSPSPLVEKSPLADKPDVESNSTPNNAGTQRVPRFLVTDRSKTSGSFSSILCFPGGNSSPADGDLTWVQHFGYASKQDISTGVQFIKSSAEQPAIYAGVSQTHTSLGQRLSKLPPQNVPKNISLRVTAIRETFEETGILLCKLVERKHGKLGLDSASGVGCEASVYNFESPEEITYWQESVRRNTNLFLKMCEELCCIPDVNALVEWSDWLTPNCFGMQRYDTIFYMALLPQAYPLYICPTEVDSASWLTADQVLKDCEERKCKMITPQIYELARLRHATTTRLKQLIKLRLNLGIERWCAAYIRAKDGYLSVFPGDDLYPEDMRIDAYEPIRSLDSTLEELRETSYTQHRIEYRSEFDFRVVIKNYKERAGHIYLDK